MTQAEHKFRLLLVEDEPTQRMMLERQLTRAGYVVDTAENGADALIKLSREFVEAGATHLIYTCPIPYSAAGARRVWSEVVTPLRG